MADRRIRILRVIARLNVGGPAIHAALLARRLNPERFHTLTVFGSIGPGEADMADLLGDADRLVIAELGRAVRPGRDLIAFARLLRTMRRFRPHIVHTHTAKAGAVGRLAALACRAAGGPRPRLVHTFHGHVFAGYFPRWQTRLVIAAERTLARVTDRVVAVSPQVAEELAVTYRVVPRERIVTIPVGLDLDRFARVDDGTSLRRALGVSGDVALVGIVGRLVPIKNHELFLQACRLLAADGRRALRFVIVGGGELREALERRTSELGLDGLVIFAGWRRDLERVYAALDAVVLTSDNEGTPVSLIEAMACGRPVVATAVGGVPDVVSHGRTGLLVPPRDAGAVANAIAAILDSADLAARLGTEARRDVLARFSADRLVADIEQLYDSLLAG
ncbi:MAG TPA: glycosyltransferase [Vicinamibacterales bacterium]|nr:glycosyltransferase [Vicinamibacterales bacterium]